MSTTIDFSNTSIQSLITHHVGNKLYEDALLLSDESSGLSEASTMDYLLTYFLNQFQPVDIQCFSHTIDLEMNEVYSCVKRLFHDQNSFTAESQNIAKMLYEHTDHPQIKSGELNVVLFNNITLNDQIVNAVGLFKSESQEPFLKMGHHQNSFLIDHDFGFGLKSLDKACLILEADEDEGYQVLIIDKKNKTDAQYWVNDFLRLKPMSDEYNVTKEFLSVAKDFVTDQLPLVEPVEKTDQIDLLNKTMDYFKSNETFNKDDFQQEVFQSEKLISSFKDFEEGLGESRETPKSFYISDKAVKKQTRIYKSVLKLDKNFHVYIHGNRDMIEKGMDENGRKYYKIFYENEA